MVGHGGSSAGSYLADSTSPIPSHYASIVVTSTLRVNQCQTVRLILHAYIRNLVQKCYFRHQSNNAYTYNAHIHHCLAAYTAAPLNICRPNNVMVGMIVNGPIHLSRKPTAPVAPSITSNRAANIMAPCT